MLRFGLLLSLLSLLVVVSSAQLSLNASAPELGATTPGLQWRRQTDHAAWSPRAGGVVEWYKGSVRATASRTLAGPVMLMYGVGVWTPSSPDDRADVWYSTDKGKHWYMVYPDGQGFEPLFSAITVQDSKGRQFRIQGTNAQPPNGGAFSQVYMSVNGGSKWTEPGPGLESPDGRFLGQAVVDSRDYIYVTMGQHNGGPLQDVWVSVNQARTWTQVKTTGALPPARAVHGSVATKYRDGTDAIYIMYGWERGSIQTGIGNVYRNDVWVSTTGGKTWNQILAHAPWAARGDCQVEITDSGVIIIAGGISSANGDSKKELNDVWASLDGGYSWGQCTENAEFSDRQFPYTLIDDEGYLYVMGGLEEQNGGRLVNDVWRSTFSYNDVNEVAARCNLFVPACGVGLKCLPNEDETFMQGGWGVSCAACPYSASAAPPSPAKAADITMTILFVVFLMLFLLVTSVLVFTYYKMRKSGVSSPIPLPAGAQRWWNGNTDQGLGEGLHKGNTDSADTYNPLSIRDQM